MQERTRLAGAFERYQQAVPKRRVTDWLKGQSMFSRKGKIPAWLVIWLIIFQRLQPKGTLGGAVREVLTGATDKCFRGKKLSQCLSANTSAYSQARTRLPLEVVEKVSDLIFESLNQQPQTLPGLERPMFLLDGTSILMAHSKDLAKAYPPASNQYGVSHWPVMRVATAHDVVSGLAIRPAWGPMFGEGATSEQGLTKTIICRLPPQCGVMGDRNYGVFSMAYHASRQDHPCIFRLSEPRARKLNGGITPAARTDKQIRWLPSREDLRNNPEIPADAFVEGSLMALKLDHGGKRGKIYLFTTLNLTAEATLQVYGYRWYIETDLRSLKREVRLHMLHVQSPAMAEKELVLGVAAYNLIRAAINDAAAALELNPRDFSFSLAQDTINAFLPLLANARTERERKAITKQMLRVFSYSTLPKRRKRRSAPREVWPHQTSFPRRKLTKVKRSKA